MQDKAKLESEGSQNTAFFRGPFVTWSKWNHRGHLVRFQTVGNPTCCGTHTALSYWALIQLGCSGAEQGVASSLQGEGKHSIKTLQLLLEWPAQLTAKRTIRSAGTVFLAYFTSQSSLGRQPGACSLHPWPLWQSARGAEASEKLPVLLAFLYLLFGSPN